MLHRSVTARLFMCLSWVAVVTSQPFLMARLPRCADGNAARMPQVPIFTLRISLMTQAVHFGPAAVPLAAQVAMRQTSRGDILQPPQLVPGTKSTSLQIDLRRVKVTAPISSNSSLAGAFSLLRIMRLIAERRESEGVCPFSAAMRR